MKFHFKLQHHYLFGSLLFAVSTLSLACPASNGQGETLLKGTVNEQGYLSPKTPSLNLGDLNRQRDAFGNSEASSLPSVGEAFEPPPGAFNLPGRGQPTGNNTNQGNPMAGQVTSQDFNSQFASAVPGLDNSTPPFNMSAEQSAPLTGQLANDPDNTPEMQLAWDQWHKRVAATIYQKFNALAQLAFKFSHPLACYVTYTVTRDGRIINAELQQKSSNVAFNAMVMMVINSMSGQLDVLAFPPGSRRTVVSKAGMFTQNYGVEGFKYTTGDRETIPAR